MATENISDLEQACTAAHSEYREARKALAAAIGKPESSEALEELIASIIDIGLNGTLHRLKSQDPKVVDAIARVSEASHHLGHAINAREDARIGQNPKHQRVYVDDGREFTLDMEKGIWTYLDDPTHPVKVALTKTDKLPYDLPGFKPGLEQKKPNRKRQPRM